MADTCYPNQRPSSMTIWIAFLSLEIFSDLPVFRVDLLYVNLFELVLSGLDPSDLPARNKACIPMLRAWPAVKEAQSWHTHTDTEIVRWTFDLLCFSLFVHMQSLPTYVWCVVLFLVCSHAKSPWWLCALSRHWRSHMCRRCCETQPGNKLAKHTWCIYARTCPYPVNTGQTCQRHLEHWMRWKETIRGIGHSQLQHKFEIVFQGCNGRSGVCPVHVEETFCIVFAQSFEVKIRTQHVGIDHILVPKASWKTTHGNVSK